MEMVPVPPPAEISTFDKRMVVVHPNGMCQIFGWRKAGLMPEPMINLQQSDDPKAYVAICLVTTKPRYHLYKTLMVPGMNAAGFDKAQR